MKTKIILMLFLVFSISNIFAQNTLNVKLIDCDNKEPLIGANIILQILRTEHLLMLKD